MQIIPYCSGEVGKEQPFINITGSDVPWDPKSLDEFPINWNAFSWWWWWWWHNDEHDLFCKLLHALQDTVPQEIFQVTLHIIMQQEDYAFPKKYYIIWVNLAILITKISIQPWVTLCCMFCGRTYCLHFKNCKIPTCKLFHIVEDKLPQRNHL